MLVRTDRKSALWWCSGDFCEEESSVYLLIFPLAYWTLNSELCASQPGILPLSYTPNLGVVFLALDMWCCLRLNSRTASWSPCISSGMALCTWGGENVWAWQRPWDYLVKHFILLFWELQHTLRGQLT